MSIRALLIALWIPLTIGHTNTAHAQQQRVVDSLIQVLKEELPDGKRALVMMNLAINYEGLDSVKCAQAYRQAVAFARRKNLTYETGRIYYNESFPFNFRGNYARAELLRDSAMWFLNQSDDPDAEFRRAQVMDLQGNAYRDQKNDLKTFIAYKLKTITIYEKIQRWGSVLTGYVNLSMAYKDMHLYDKEKEYAFKALAVARRLNEHHELFTAYTFVALAYMMNEQPELAMPYLDSCELHYGMHPDARTNIIYHTTAGSTYVKRYEKDSLQQHLVKAQVQFERGQAIAQRYGIRNSYLDMRLFLARVLTLQGKFSEAQAIIFPIVDELRARRETLYLPMALEYMAYWHAARGDYNNAYTTYKEYRTLSDSLSNERNKAYAADLEKKYEAEKREGQIRQLEADNNLQQITNAVLAGSAFVLLMLLLLGYRTYRQRQRLQVQRIRELETEKQLLATEAVLKGEEQERSRLAKDLHDGLGGMLSGIKYSLNTMKGNLIMTPENQQAFGRSIDMLDSSIKEMRRVAHNMMPETLLRFGLDAALRDFCSDINQSGALTLNYQSIGLDEAVLDQTAVITIFRIVQELVHNIMKHAAATSAIAQVTYSAKRIAITVEDNGRGFDPALLHNSTGIGWTNLRSRIEFLKGRWDVTSRAGEGTSVHVEMDL